MICPRCDGADAREITGAVDNCWRVFACPFCNFTWRDLEADYITDPSRYNPAFKLNRDEVDKLVVNPPVPPRAK